ncbi:hypothetical protein BDA99DRAFT_498241 [Phascolomyces articulosus]|uniref:DNA repair protein REV1 n=1 Tax=Phascolomyces articulosus TaxID=60185 RepID=A0AAD5PIM9_9FUNG|nr:hypothetical protein BDA99DRAFT_498241 [Phascolomyces articulosus]
MDPYGAIQFSDWKTYMTNKQAKLKDQEKILEESSSQAVPQIFNGLSIYINGYTNPPQSELRRQIIIHGGDYQHYLKKSNVTHIIASNLTQAKCNEFRAYKVVKPEWLMDSIRQKQLLPWNEYRITGKDTAQKELPFQQANKQQIPQQQQKQQKLQEEKVEEDMENPQGKVLNANLLSVPWNRENTSVNPGFVKKYYSSSRLHHLSTWKSEIKAEIIKKLDEKFAVKGKGKKRKYDGTRIVMHVDFDCFFASVGLLDRPHLKDKPVAVSHVQQAKVDSSSDIASCNYIARAAGVRNGMHIGAAKQKCPELQVIPYEFDKYKAISETFYEVLYEFAQEIEPVSVDEALIEVSGDSLMATDIRNRIREKTQCEVSVGIGPNILLAKLATKKAKPAGQYYCSPEQVQQFSVSDLPGVGRAMTVKLENMGVSNVADLLKMKLPTLQSSFGPKKGQILYEFARGIDERPLKHEQERQSVSADISWGVRFETDEQAKRFMEELADEVSKRLLSIERKGKRITLNILRRRLAVGEAWKRLGHGECDSFSKSIALAIATDDSETIAQHSLDMLFSFKFDVTDLRGLGINITKLESHHGNETKQQKLSFSPTKETSPPPNNLPPEIDPEVFAELPPDVQEELKRQYNISEPGPLPPSPKRAENNTRPLSSQPLHEQQNLRTTSTEIQDIAIFDTSSSPSEPILTQPLASLPDIPPWSQLDPTSLLALPESMRQQVLQLYSTNPPSKSKYNYPVQLPPAPQQQQRHHHHHPDTKVSIRGRTRLASKRSPSPTMKGTTLTQMFNPKKSPHRHPSPEIRPPWESSIWNELPASMQAEIQADHRREQLARERNIRNDHFREARTKLMDNAASTAKIIDIPLPSQNEPKLLGNSAIEDVRQVLYQWIEAFPAGPEPEDVDVVVKYLLELVKTKNLENAQLAIMYFDDVTKQKGTVWRSCAKNLKQMVSDAVKALYNCGLRC